MIVKKYFVGAIAIMGLLFITHKVSAQTGIIVRGRVIEKGTGQPLPGVTVTEKNKSNRNVNGIGTDINGNYELKIADANDSLYFTQIGLKTIVRAIKGQQVINVTMAEDGRTLDAVNINAVSKASSDGFLGISDANRSDSRTKINMKDLEDIPATSIDQVLQGKAAGLLISMNSGNPGSGSSIQIRGATSIGLGSQPLIVVDNVPFKANVNVDLSNPDALSELVNISPTDIASIEILKDAAATAVYGSDAANGVILITTKRGDSQKPRVSLTSSLSLSVPQTPIPLLNGDQYKTMILEAYQNRYGTGIDLTTSPIANLFLQPGALNYENYNNNTNWQKETTRPLALTQDYNASIVGGGESAKYLVSLGDNNSLGPIYGTSFNRISTRFNFDYQIANNLSFTSDISYVESKKHNFYQNNNTIANIKAPILPVYTQDQYGNNLSTYFQPGTGGFQNDVQNPIALIDNAINQIDNQRLDAKLTVRYSPFKGFQINNLFSTSNESTSTQLFLPHSASGLDFYRQNNLYLRIDNNLNTSSVIPQKGVALYFKDDITYRFTLPKNYSLTAGLFTIYSSNSRNAITLTSVQGPSGYLTEPYNSEIYNTISSQNVITRTLSNIFQTFFAYKELYSITASIRREGNSNFGANNRFAWFPAISGYWRPSAQPVIKKLTKGWLDDFKIRGSYGITGRGPDQNNATTFTYSANAPFIDIQGVTPDNIQLVNLRWEKSKQLDVGADLSFFKGRLTFVTDYSVTTTRDLLLNTPISVASGFESILTNFGTIQAKTLEFTIAGDIIRTAKWNVGGSFNISTGNNRVLSLPNNNAPVINSNVLDNGKYLSLINVGDPIGTFYGLKSLGVYKTDGDAYAQDANGNFITDLNGAKIPMRWNNANGQIFTGGDAHYADLNHDGVINQQDVVALGNTTPKFYGGFILRASYANTWNLLAVFNYQSHFDIINGAEIVTTNEYSNNNQSIAVLRRWRKQGDVTDVPRALYGDGHNWVGSDRYIEDGSFVRLNSVSLAYSVPKSVLTKLRLRSLKFALSVSNPKTWTNYSGADPTISANRNNPFAVGIDNSLTPTPILYTLAVTANF